ncbi:hypothetical protein HZB89_00735 [archaeon]|nr:hypothetical protein [archaeon]
MDEKEFEALVQLKFAFEDLVNGFGLKHAQVLALLKEGALDAKAVWLKAGLERREVFEVLSFLLEKKLVIERKQGEQVLFELACLRLVLDDLIHEKKQRLDLKHSILDWFLPEAFAEAKPLMSIAKAKR